MKAVKQETRIHASLVSTNNACIIMFRLRFLAPPPRHLEVVTRHFVPTATHYKRT